MKCSECGSDYIKKVGTIVEKDSIAGKYKVHVEYYECENCHDKLYSLETCKILDKERLKRRKKIMKYEKYMHHGNKVWVRSDLIGKHRDYCLCMVCKKLDVTDRKKNCKIANAVFKNSVKFNLVTPMWECPEFLCKNYM